MINIVINEKTYLFSLDANKKKLEKYQKQLTNFELNTLVKIKEVYITMNNPHTVSSIID
jgi:DNA integrity scanning protein DisA with diadenylate cyclase activity